MTTKARRAPTKNRYWWFRGESVRELCDRLNVAGPDTARLEVRIKGDKMTLEVVAEFESLASASQPINDSRVCPPICPG